MTLSPLETAKVFDPSMMQIIGRNSVVEGILKEIGGIGVKYNDGVMVNGENLKGITQQEAKQGDEVREHGRET